MVLVGGCVGAQTRRSSKNIYIHLVRLISYSYPKKKPLAIYCIVLATRCHKLSNCFLFKKQVTPHVYCALDNILLKRWALSNQGFLFIHASPLRFLFFIIYVIMSVSISDQHPDIYRLKNHFHVSLFSSGDGASDVVLNLFVPILSRTVCLQSQLFLAR